MPKYFKYTSFAIVAISLAACAPKPEPIVEQPVYNKLGQIVGTVPVAATPSAVVLDENGNAVSVDEPVDTTVDPVDPVDSNGQGNTNNNQNRNTNENQSQTTSGQ